jgi:hypothetical protein
MQPNTPEQIGRNPDVKRAIALARQHVYARIQLSHCPAFSIEMCHANPSSLRRQSPNDFSKLPKPLDSCLRRNDGYSTTACISGFLTGASLRRPCAGRDPATSAKAPLARKQALIASHANTPCNHQPRVSRKIHSHSPRGVAATK